MGLSNGFAIEPSAQARRTRHDRPSQPTPWSAHLRPCLTRASTSRIGFLVCTFWRKRSISEGICSSFKGVKVEDVVIKSFAGVDAVVLAWVPTSAGSGEKREPMRELGGYLSSKMSQLRTVSAVAGCGGICRKSRDDSCAVEDAGTCWSLPRSSLREMMGDKPCGTASESVLDRRKVYQQCQHHRGITSGL
jgi:hypothetical protein